MESTIKFKRIYSDEHMTELLVDISKINISTSISCYTKTGNLNELSILCKEFISTLAPFNWVIGTKEYAYLSIDVEPYDKLGHIKLAITMINNKSDLDAMKSEFFILLDLGLIEELGEGIKKLVIHDTGSLIIQQS